MSEAQQWAFPETLQPKADETQFDLASTLDAVVLVRAEVPPEAFTAETLGTERAGNGVVIREDGLVLTVGYLIMEADTVWLTTHDGRSVPGHVVGFDAATGFGLVQALQPLKLPALPLGRSDTLGIGDRAVVAGAGGRGRSVAAQV